MIKHIKCDIFESGADVICHQVNCQGVMGSGIAKQVREKFPEVYKAYLALTSTFKVNKHDLLGQTQIVPTPYNIQSPDKWVRIANLFSQEKYGYDGHRYTDYIALKNCLTTLKDKCSNTTIAIPYLMGCYRGGGDWNVVYKMIEEVFADSDCEVLICEYNGG